MSAAELILDLNRLGIRLEADGERLRFFPQSAVTPEIATRLRSHKAELLAILGPPPPKLAIDVTDAVVVWQTALDLLEQDPLFSPEDIVAMRAAKPEWTQNDGPSSARGGAEGPRFSSPLGLKSQEKVLDNSASTE